ncbi:46 kDa FK506-binding nuclear protein [Metopolophium dirhodum]|uniref:46 kDa FK506-binding nuclear protein n=1 Tax=Metopolophium dirhodum TaxID=44670 RepID=UPI00298FBE04|nr:46 kDa FK506-binding nuclear protein [Metopolophium dirhodum]
MWSIVMEPGKKYSTVVENTFHLSMATLDLESVKKADDVHTVYVETDDNPRVILCHLSKASKLYQCRLDHIFPRGTDLKFVTTATANIHMTGYLDLNEDDELYSDLESESEEEGTQIEKPVQGKGNKRKSEDNVSKKNKSIKLDESNQSDEDSDDENDSDEIMDFEDDSDDDGIKLSDLVSDDDEDEEDDDDDDEDDDEDEEDSDDESEDVPVLTKKAKELQKTPKKQLNGNDQKSPKQEQKTPKGQEKTPKGQKTPMPKTPDANQTLINGSTESSKKKKNKEPKTPLSALKTKPDTPLPKDKQNQQQKLNGGVIINDLKVGDGAVAKPGKNVKVYYIGRLKSTGKVFDSMQKGPGFTFGLQRGEVIKGWDIGIAGMKVGGKRKVICPPNMAYGAKGSPPEIPPNSTLVFDVELKHVN